MRIVVDLQGCQSSAHGQRGIGRYSMALVRAMARNCGDDELIIALNGSAQGGIGWIRSELADVVPGEQIVVWHGVDGTRGDQPGNRWRSRAARLAREDFLRSLRPDIVHVSSFFEGFIDDSVTSIPNVPEDFIAVVTLYDLIPLVNQDIYLSDQQMRDWYFGKLDELKRADLLLGISAHTCKEAVQHLGFPAERLINISAAVDPAFAPGSPGLQETTELRGRFGLTADFVMYTGGIDHRKNVDALIAAYARLPDALRQGRQLVIVCSVSLEQRDHLIGVGAKAGLAAGELVLTGYVRSSDLVRLYQLCELFVFPSWHEGFGLPVLEAMACGAAVIGADTSSIPEVIGRQDALFDPHSVEAITAKLAQMLQDPDLRAELAAYGVLRSKGFGWDRCARVALDAMRALHRKRASDRSIDATLSQPLRRLAFVSPLPPERSGIADYSAELLPALARYYQIEVVTDQTEITDPWISQHTPVRSVEWFRTHADDYDRVLYHFGNSPFHGHMFELLARIPGTVVLHDFYLSGVASHLEWAGKIPRFWTRSLYGSHGYRALIAREQAEDSNRVLEEYPCNADVLEHADGIIVHSRFSTGLADDWYGAGTSTDWSVIPLLRAIPQVIETRETARELLGLDSEEMLVCCFGILSPSKLNHVILDAWLALPAISACKARLVFVGASHDARYDAELKATIAQRSEGHTVTITDYVDQATYRRYLAAADIGIQLRSSSRGETSAAVLDCMASAIPTIVNAHGSMAEIPADVVLQLPDHVTSPILSDALANLLVDAGRRRNIGERALAYCKDQLDPDHVAMQYRDAIERYHSESPQQRLRYLARDLARSEGVWAPAEPHDLERLAIGVASNQVRNIKTRQFLVDVSELVRRDAKSGIQRVVRSILMQLLMAPPEGYRVEPVYGAPGARYRYARRFTTGFLGLDMGSLVDDVVDVEAGDVLLGIDLALEEVPANVNLYRAMRDKGVAVYFVVYDLLPLILADYFPAHAYELFSRWVETLATVGDGALCISKAVADELVHHLDAIRPNRPDPFRIGYFHLGADIDSSIPTHGISDQDARSLEILSGMQVLLMVGTIEPRKGHAQTLDAFDELCARNNEMALAVVGRPGWMTEALVERIRSHPQTGKRLFWFEGASDEVLARLYALAQALLVPSNGEGFGLPLIEAAQHGLPVICRDLPVFREIAGDGATYFSGDSAADLAVVIETWMAAAPDERPSSANIPRITWRQSCDQLVNVITQEQWLACWDDRRGYCFPAYDRNVVVEAGYREMGNIVTHGRAGMLLSCKADGVRAGSYRFRIFGETATLRGEPTFELLGNDKVLAQGVVGAVAAESSLLADVVIEFARDEAVFQSRLWVGTGTYLRVHHCVLEPIALH